MYLWRQDVDYKEIRVKKMMIAVRISVVLLLKVYLFRSSSMELDLLLEINVCLPSIIHGRWKRNVDDLIIPPYYEQKQQLYPYGIDKPALPFYKVQEPKQPVDNKNFGKNESRFMNEILIIILEWDQCQFHEDCGEENCCIGHPRFRSARKWFCRPKQHGISEACEPLTKYRSLKNVPVWTEQPQQQENNEELLR